MRIIIKGIEYEAVTVETAQLLHLMELQQQSRTLFPPNGLNMKWIREMHTRAQQSGDNDEDEDDALVGLAILVFLSRRANGDRVTFAEACCITAPDVTVVDDPEVVDPEASEAVDPTEPAPDVVEAGAR